MSSAELPITNAYNRNKEILDEIMWGGESHEHATVKAVELDIPVRVKTRTYPFATVERFQTGDYPDESHEYWDFSPQLSIMLHEEQEVEPGEGLIARLGFGSFKLGRVFIDWNAPQMPRINGLLVPEVYGLGRGDLGTDDLRELANGMFGNPEQEQGLWTPAVVETIDTVSSTMRAIGHDAMMEMYQAE